MKNENRTLMVMEQADGKLGELVVKMRQPRSDYSFVWQGQLQAIDCQGKCRGATASVSLQYIDLPHDATNILETFLILIQWVTTWKFSPEAMPITARQAEKACFFSQTIWGWVKIWHPRPKIVLNMFLGNRILTHTSIHEFICLLAFGARHSF